ncbi:hypothetical protein [Mucilaginibacter psychrotolerans]|nr:hypothetical protein [Mucilaginibacter psychrotolerans]
MYKVLTFVFMMAYCPCYAQNSTGLGRIEFYLLKRHVPNVSRATSAIEDLFKIEPANLEDTAFIKDSELKLMTKTDTLRNPANNQLIQEEYWFTVPEAVVKRIYNLNIPLCCGRQFVIVVNGNVSYTGYFWNIVSSFGSDWITAFAYGNTIKILRKLPDYDDIPHLNDPRNEPLLIDCLKATKRYSTGN